MEYVDFLRVNYNPWLSESPLQLSHLTALHSSGKLTQSRINYVRAIENHYFSLKHFIKNKQLKISLPHSSLPACVELKKSKHSERCRFFTFLGVGKIIFTNKTESRFLFLSLPQRPRGKLNQALLCLPQIPTWQDRFLTHNFYNL